jgi:hypothetical protein
VHRGVWILRYVTCAYGRIADLGNFGIMGFLLLLSLWIIYRRFKSLITFAAAILGIELLYCLFYSGEMLMQILRGIPDHL